MGFDLLSDVERSGYTVEGASTYFWINSLAVTIRVSDHAQHAFGGYSAVRGDRHGRADFSISPSEARVEDLRWWLIERMNRDRLPASAMFCDDDELAALGLA